MREGIDIVPASPAELPGIMAIEAGFGEEAFSRRRMRYLMTRAQGMFFTAKRGGEVAGYASVLTLGRNNTARLYSIAVAPEHRGVGIAEGLMDKMIEFARGNGCRAIFLEVNTANTAAISLYTKKGFTTRSVKPLYYKNGDDALSMVLELRRAGCSPASVPKQKSY